MGKLIKCSGKIAETPYCFPKTKTKVYSIEEVCYYIGHNIYMMQEEIFDQEFADWIRSELGMEITADKLDQMREDHNHLKDIVVTLCCSCDYYEETEINELISIMDEMKNLPIRGCLKIKADSLWKSGSLERARQEYECILRSDDMLNASSAEYGNMLHNMGVICAEMGEYEQAADAFQKAFAQNHSEESMHAYLFALQLGEMNEAYEQAIRRFGIRQEQKNYLHAQYERAVRQSHEEKKYRKLRRLKNYLDEGREQEYLERVEDTISRIKQEYRQEVM